MSLRQIRRDRLITLIQAEIEQIEDFGLRQSLAAELSNAKTSQRVLGDLLVKIRIWREEQTKIDFETWRYERYKNDPLKDLVQHKYMFNELKYRKLKQQYMPDIPHRESEAVEEEPEYDPHMRPLIENAPLFHVNTEQVFAHRGFKSLK